MGTLSPTLNAGIRFDQPVQQPSALGAVSGLVDLFTTKRPAQVSASNRLAADKEQYYNQLQVGKSLIEQGQGDKGRRVISSAYRKFSGIYGREHEDVNTSFNDATGISYDVEITGSPVNEATVSNTPEFNIQAAIIQSQNPGMDAQRVYELAFEKEVNRLNTELKIKEHEANKQANWIEMEEDYVQRARNAGDMVRGMITAAQSDEITTPEEARSIRKFYMDMFGSATKPVGVDQASWDDYKKNYIDSMTTIVDGAIGVSQTNGITEDMSRALNQVTRKLVEKGELPASLLFKMQGDSVGSYDAFIELIKKQAVDPKWSDNYNFLVSASFDELVAWATDFEAKTTLDELGIDPTEFNKQSDKTKRDSILNSSSFPTGAGPEQLAVSLIEQHGKLESIVTRALQPDDFAKVFNVSYFRALDKVFQANPAIGRQLAQQAVDVTNSQLTAMSLAMTSEAQQLGLRIVGGKLVPGETPAQLQFVVDNYFGGDWELALNSRGIDSKGRKHSLLIATINTVEKSFLPRLEKMTAAIDSVNTLVEKYLPPEVTGLGGNDDVKGSIGEDTLAGEDNMTLPAGIAMAHDLIRREESFRDTPYWDVNAYRVGYGSDTVTKSDGTVVPVVKGMKITREDAERDLRRREREFAMTAGRQVGTDVWTSLPGNVTAALTSVAYNYGSLPKSVVKAVGTGDNEAIAVAVESLPANPERRKREAALIRGQQLPPSAGVAYSRRPVERPEPDMAVRSAEQRTSSVQEPQRATERAAEGGSTPSEGGDTQEVSEAAQQGAQQVWGQLASQTKSMLIRLFGSEEEVIKAIASKEISKEDLL